MFNPFFHPLRQALVDYVPLVGPGSISIQSGSFNIPALSNIFDLTIPEVNLSLTALIWSGCSAENGSPEQDMAQIFFLDSTTIRGIRHSTTSTTPVYCEYSYIIFPSSLIKSINHYQAELSWLTNYYDNDIIPVDLSKSIIAFNGTLVGADTTTDKWLVRLTFLNDHTVRSYKGVSGIDSYTRFTVIEFS